MPMVTRSLLVSLAVCVVSGTARDAAAQHSVATEPRSPIFAPGDSTLAYPELTLDEVIARALAVSPTVASGTGGVRVARSSEHVALGAYLPTVTATSAAVRTDATAAQTTTGINSGGRSTIGNHSMGLAATLDLFTGGRRGANAKLARADLRAASSTLVSARYVVTLAAQQSFYEVLRATDLVRVARVGLAQADQLLRYTGDMFRAGTATRSDLLRAQLQSTTMQEQLLAATDTMVAASYALGSVVGVNGPVGAAVDSASIRLRPLALDDSTIVRLAADASPSVTVAEAVAAASEASLRAARTQYVPTISASTGYNWTASSAAVTGVARPGWTVTVATSYPLFNGFQREDAVTRAEVVADVARVTVGDARRSARARAAQLLGALGTITATISLATEAVRSAREDLRVQTERYRAGISTMLDVLTSETALVQAEYNLARAKPRYQITRAAVEALVGRGL